jgi:hypothetical protein
MQGQIEATRRRGRRRKKLPDDLGDRRGYSHLKEEALDCIKWRNRFGSGFGPVVWQITDDGDDDDSSFYEYLCMINTMHGPYNINVTMSDSSCAIEQDCRPLECSTIWD